MIITIASGKGGTGKTTLAVNLAVALARSNSVDAPVRLLDCDVEEPNDHLFLPLTLIGKEDVCVPKPQWNPELCTGCGKCAEACHYNALAVVKGKVLFFPELCHACGVCTYVCPEGAMSEKERTIGRVEVHNVFQGLSFVHGILNVGEVLAPNVVGAAKGHVLEDAVNIIDASPGTACPVVAAVSGSDVAVLVTEPTPFGLNDLKLAVGLALKLGVPTGIVVNRSDGSDDLIQQYADSIGVPVIGRIPFKREYAETYSRGGLLVDHHPEVRDNLMAIHAEAGRLAGTPAQPAPPEEAVPSASARPPKATGAPARAFREMTVISGKGGTGKTTVTVSLAALLEDKVLADCDVDAADLHLLLAPDVREVSDFIGGQTAEIDPDACIACGKCAQLCHFNAIDVGDRDTDGRPLNYRINEYTCEGCGLCGFVCPAGAVSVEAAVTGQRYVSDTLHGPLSHAKLGIAEENSGKLVTAVREHAADLAVEAGADKIVGDGSPGMGCPVVASISGVDRVLVVTEPTVSGVHDLERVLHLARQFRVPAMVCINKCDLNEEQAERIRQMAAETGARLVGEVPFDPEVNAALMAGQILVSFGDGPAATAVRRIADELSKELGAPTAR